MSIEPYKPGRGKRHGTKAEKKLAHRLGATLTPASGALPGAKGDMTTERFRIESKSTVKDSFRLPLETLCKAADEATEQGQVAAVAVQFVTSGGRLRRCGSWVAVPEHVFRELTEGT